MIPPMASRGKLRPILVGALLLGAILFLSAPPAALAQSGEEIRSFASDITVLSDGRISVTETIVYFFPEPRHGIYRDIPTSYETDQGEKFSIPLDIKSVTDGRGGQWAYQIEGTKYAVRIKIGDADKMISGEQTYVISYDASGALRYFPDHDELYWNATGTEWTVPLLRAAVSVHLPDNIPADQVTLKCFTGQYGSTSAECVKNLQGRTAEFAASDFLTVVVGWPPGLVAKLLPLQPGWWEKYWTWLLFGLPFLIPIFAFIILFRRWWRFGRDIKGSPTLVVQYDPPDKLTPAEVGTLLDERADIKDMSATIVHLAVRGFIKIREIEKQGLIFKSKDYEFVKLKDYAFDPAVKPYESSILAVLFSSGATTSTLSSLKENYAFKDHLTAIQGGMYDQLVRLGYYEQSPEKVRSVYVGIGVMLLMIGMFTMIFAAPLMITGAILVLFGFIMPRRTAAGVAALDHAKGFREYLSQAEKYRLQWQEKENIFEQFLPYAMVFGVVDKWCQAFEGLSLKQPDWYEGAAFRAGAFNAAAFNSAFGSLNTSMNSAVMSRPSQSGGGSGFGGGGFSGGGGGGGGGGSW